MTFSYAALLGTTVYTVLVVSMFIRCALLTYTWTWMSLVCFWLSFIFYFVFLLVYQVSPTCSCRVCRPNLSVLSSSPT